VLAVKSNLPTWLRTFSAVAGVCGIFAPAFFTLFVFHLWTLVCGVTLTRSGAMTRPRDAMAGAGLDFA
jgi:hypothetical protein